MGKLKRHWLDEGQMGDILVMIERAKEQGVCIRRACALLLIARCLVGRWRMERDKGKGLRHLKPGATTKPVHRLFSVERESVLQMAAKEAYADLSHLILAVTDCDPDIFFVLFPSIFRNMRFGLCQSYIDAGVQRPHNGCSLPPVLKELTGPNQRWRWEISYLPTYEKGIFLYLYLLLDEYSHKALSWLVSWHQTAEQAQRLIEKALINENTLDLP